MKLRILVLIAFLIMLTGALSAEETLDLAIGNWEPFTSDRFENSRVLEQLVREIFALSGVGVTYSYYPWMRSHEQVKSGQNDGTFPWIWTEERSKDFYVSEEPIMTEETVIYYRRDFDFDWETFEDLKGLRIGGTIGYATTEILEDYGLPIEFVQNEELNYRKLLAGRIDILPGSKLVGQYMVRMLFDQSHAALLTYHPRPLIEENFYFMVSKHIPDGQEIVSQFDKGLKILRENGRYEEIMSRIVSPDKSRSTFEDQDILSGH
ncbi:MAG: transporter substrate-binding domain-containing protein [Spirochaetales bacterium]|nr:transporter substrate-binding domain-containing protein [Spirochaetales bacterium]